MKRILMLCEGQTEETFVQRILAPHLHQFDKHPIPTVLVTKKVQSGQGFWGGVTSYERIRRDVRNLLKDSNAVCVTTMLDYYGLPGDFPGKSTLSGATPYQRVSHLEDAFARDIGDSRFLPYLMLHEFEALLFVDVSAVAQVMDRPAPPQSFGDLSRFSAPEEINDGRDTHPSVRLQQGLPGYSKALHGPLAVERIGLASIRARCPHFNNWLENLEMR